MVIINLLGCEIELYENLYYHPRLDYWIQVEEDGSVIIGLTPTGALKEGDYRSIEFTVGESDRVQPGDTIAVAITGKIKYLETFAGGVIEAVNKDLEKEIPSFEENPYTDIWLVRLSTEKDVTGELVTASEYCTGLERVNHHAVPQGKKAAGSPTCRSVYQAIREQKYKNKQ